MERGSLTSAPAPLAAYASPPADAPAARLRALWRRPLLTVFCIALAVRVVLAVAIWAVAGGSLFPDDTRYSEMAAEAAAGQSGEWTRAEHRRYQETATLLVPLTALYRVLGPVKLAGQLLVAVLGAAAAALTARLALEALEVGWATAAGLAVALLPSQVLWSALVLKDAPVWALLAALALVVAVAGRSSGRRLVGLAAAAAALLLLLGFLRQQTLVVAAWALALSSWAGTPERRLARGLGALAIAVVVPWAAGQGPAGVGFLTGVGPLAGIRAVAAGDAETSFVDEPTATSTTVTRAAPTTAAPSPAPTVAPSTTAASSAARPTRTPPRAVEDGPADDLRALPRGLSVMLLEPYPWPPSTNSRLRFAQAETLVWYPLLALAVVGAAALRRHLRVIAFPVLVGGAIVVTYAVTEGNLGTAYRHRGEFVWIVALMAAAGGREVLRWRHGRRMNRV